MKTLLDSWNYPLDISDKEDWESASRIVELIYSKSDRQKELNSFLKITCNTIITTSILLCHQTIYPDLLSVKIFLLLPQLKARICYANKQQQLTRFGTEVSNGLQLFTCCPTSEKTLKNIFIEAIMAIDEYLREMNLTFSKEDFRSRREHLEQLFPLPQTRDRNQFVAMFQKAYS